MRHHTRDCQSSENHRGHHQEDAGRRFSGHRADGDLEGEESMEKPIKENLDEDMHVNEKSEKKIVKRIVRPKVVDDVD